MSKKDIIQLIITGALIIILLMLVFGGKGDGKKSVGSAPLVMLDEISFEQIMGLQKNEMKGLYARLEEETNNLIIKRSPFSKQRMASASGPNLNGIFWDRIHPKAIINEKIVENGSQFNNYTIIDISVDAVILYDNNKKTELRLELVE